MAEEPTPVARMIGVAATFFAVVFTVVLFYSAGARDTGDHQLVFGSPFFPTPQAGLIYALWFLFGLVVTVLGARLAQVGLGRWSNTIGEALRETSDRQLLALVMVIGFAIPWLLRFFVLQDAPIVDDESAYYYASQLLADGRFTGTSQPFKLFFDRVFLINDGRTFTQFFLGWPMLMLPGTVLGSPELMNPLYSALTLPALFLLLRRLTSSAWAWMGVFIWLMSPFVQLSAATLMSHTSCTMALMWGFWFSFRATDADAKPWHHAAIAFTFSVAFFVRPASAVGIALAPVVYWLVSLVRSELPRRERLRALGAFGTVALVMAGLFLAVNMAIHGRPFANGYEAYYEYARSNQFRFSMWAGEKKRLIRNFRLDESPLPLMAAGIFRIFISGFGWPLASGLTVLGTFHKGALVFVGSALGFVAITMFTDPGVDAIGPPHRAELMIPLTVLVVLGFHRLEEWARSTSSEQLEIARPLLIGSLLSALVLFVPVRLNSLHTYNAPVAAALDTSEVEGHAVIFAPVPFVNTCAHAPSRHFAFWRPFNDPALQNRVIWVNHISIEFDRMFAERVFPTRTAFVRATVNGCESILLPLDSPDRVLGNFPDKEFPAGVTTEDLRAELLRAR